MASLDTNRSPQPTTSRKRRHAASNASKAISALIADPFNDEAPDPTPATPPSKRRIAQDESPYTNNSSFADSSADESSPAPTESSPIDSESSDESSAVATGGTITVLSADPIENRLHPLEPTASNLHTVAAEVGLVEDPMEFIYALEIQPGRNYQPRVVDSEGRLNVDHPLHRADGWVLQAEQLGEDGARRFTRLDKDVFSYEESMQICERLTDALNRWPDLDAISVGGTGTLRRRYAVRILFRAIQNKLFPDRPLLYHPPSLVLFKAQKSRIGHHTNITFDVINPSTLKAEQSTWSFHRQMFETGLAAHVIPEPKNVIFCHMPPLFPSSFKTLTDQPMDLTKVADLNDEAGYQRAYQIGKFITSLWLRTKSPFITRAEVVGFCRETVKPFAPRPSPWKVHRSAVSRFIEISPRITEEHPTFVFKQITIHGSDFFWLRPVFQTGKDALAKTGDERKMWQALSEAADLTNQQIAAGVTPTNLCSCKMEEKATKHHACGVCGIETVCGSLHLDYSSGLRVCNTCGRRGHQVSQASLTIARASLKDTTDSLLEIVCQISSVLKVARTEMNNWVTDKLRNHQGTQYTDDYSGHRRQPLPQRRRPDQISIDAIFPVSIHPSGQVVTHSADNIATIPFAINFLKNMQLPITLAKIADHYR
ncbi:hypothetical protein FOMA001_g14721 [Fusarium oxysporum f. sp. matthiolae]|nr:hypothetical protein FOMA001_g14721 [Fusarium oxysporum f. sp. matthiolae]